MKIGIRVELGDLSKIKIKNTKIGKWKKLNSFPIEFIFDNYPELIEKIVYLKSGTGLSYSRIKIPKLMSKDLAYLLGALRDGSLINSSGKFWVRIYDDKESGWIENIKPRIEKLFDKRIHLREHKRFNSKYLDISSKPLCSFLNILVDKNLHKDVPEIIKGSDIEIQKAYISGFFDAEGYVPYPTVKNKRYRITFNQKNQKPLIFIKQFLDTLNIKCPKISRHILPIYGKENILRFQRNFELYNPSKLKRLEILLGNTLPD
ncbi:MAG: hypothetical protein ISS95_00915 [Candidatus Aenigmarchaeota archaeon]|nr:hypothetical protein [Candidatus Aenigmarchaeota archaeon]